ncbi:MAG: lipopolysaccharide biosynthesis protein [Candidatus Marinimicrobia bacterium]|nr:lipopolysaccharide biosynthesis protein [Candidatus Neomarinimicrobiota bacterium]
MLKKIVIDALKYTPTKIIPALISILIIPILTHMFSPEQYGYLGVSLSAISLLSILTAGWTVNSNLRFYEQRKNEGSEISHIQSLIFISVLLSGFVSILSFIILKILFHYTIIPEGLNKYTNSTVLLLFLNPVVAIILSFYRMQGKTTGYTLIDVSFNTGKYIIGLTLIALMPLYFGLEAIILGGIGAAIIIITLLLFKSGFQQISLNIQKVNFLKEYWYYGYPFIIVLLSNWVITLATRNLLLILRPEYPYEVGWFTVSQNIVDRSLRILFQLLMLAALPVIYRTWENEGPSVTRKLLSTITKYYVTIFAPIVLWLSLTAQTIFQVVTGEQYWDGYVAVPWLATGIFLVGLNQYFVLPITLKKKSKLLGKITAGSALIGLVLNIVLIKTMGFIGGSISIFITFGLFTSITLYYSNNILPFTFSIKHLAKLALALALMGISVFYSLNIFLNPIAKLGLSFVVGSAIYVIVSWILKIINLKSDFQQPSS